MDTFAAMVQRSQRTAIKKNITKLNIIKKKTTKTDQYSKLPNAICMYIVYIAHTTAVHTQHAKNGNNETNVPSDQRQQKCLYL